MYYIMINKTKGGSYENQLALTPEMRGKELDLETLRKIAGEPVTYVVKRVR